MDTAYEAAEPTIVATSDGTLFTIAFDDVLRSRDGGATWERVHEYALDTPAGDQRFTDDPYLALDAATDRVYVSHLDNTVCTYLAWTGDGGSSWSEQPHACLLAGIDHQKVAAGPPGPSLNPYVTPLTETVVYLCYSQSNTVIANRCGVSYDGGLTWPIELPVVDRLRHACGGLDAVANVGPDGRVVVAFGYVCGRPVLAFSENSGLGWSIMDGPATVGSTGLDPEAQFAPDGSVWVAWRGDDYRVYLARTPDAGVSWQGPWSVTPPGVTSTEFQTLSIRPDGTFGVAFLGTRGSEEFSHDVPDETTWHLWTVFGSTVAWEDAVFTGVQATEDIDPVQVGPLCVGNMVCKPGTRNLLEFIDSTFGPDGSFHVSFTDGCLEACSLAMPPDPALSRDRHISVATVDTPTP